MATAFKLPDLGENIEGGEITKVSVAVGDTVVVDQTVIEVETGKATIDVPTDVGGKVTEILVKDGEAIKIGQTILMLEADAAEAEPAPEAKPEKKAEAPAKEEKKPAEKAKPAAKPESVKAEPTTPAAPAPVASAAAEDRVPVAAAPSVRKLAREIGVDLAAVTGTGDRGRITTVDVKTHAKQLLSQSGGGFSAGVRVPALPDFAQWGEIERQPMNMIRKITAQHMTLCWTTIPHVTQQDKADITDMERVRKRYTGSKDEAGSKVTLTSMLLKITASALKAFPMFNASVDMERHEVVLKKYIHIGVAVDTPKGLVVPVVRDVDQKNILEISVELSELAERARDGKLSPSEMQGASFTISNLGGIGGSYFTPIVNHPEVAILGVGRGTYEPVYADGAFIPRMMLPLSLSYDHRVVDGAAGAHFLRWITEAIKEPMLVVMEG